MNAKTFVDTNVLVYAHDLDSGRKRDTARKLLEELWTDRSGVLSPQVLQEFYVNVTKKIPRPIARQAARSVVSIYAAWCVDMTADQIQSAFRIEDKHRIGFWDSLIIASAAGSSASRLISEHLNDGQVIEGVRVENPFKVRD